MNLYGNGLVSTGGETLLYDGLGAVRQTTGSGSPAVQWSGSYQGYGMTSSSSGSTGNPYRWGAESGYRSDGFGPTYAAPLQKVGARYYDPEFGCFLTRDTELGQKPYAYCDSNPINCTDPSGHTAKKKDKHPSQGASRGGNIGGPISDTGKAIKEASEGVAKILEATHASASGELSVTVIHNGSYTKVVITLKIGVTK